jgi:hypothetical protein
MTLAEADVALDFQGTAEPSARRMTLETSSNLYAQRRSRW